MCFGIGQSGRQEQSFSWNMVCKQMPSRKHLSTTMITMHRGWLRLVPYILMAGYPQKRTRWRTLKDPKMCGPCLKEENGLFEMCSPFNEDAASLGDVGGNDSGRTCWSKTQPSSCHLFLSAGCGLYGLQCAGWWYAYGQVFGCACCPGWTESHAEFCAHCQSSGANGWHLLGSLDGRDGCRWFFFCITWIEQCTQRYPLVN